MSYQRLSLAVFTLDASVPAMHAYGIENPFTLAKSLLSQRQQASGPICCSINIVHFPASRRGCATASFLRAHLNPQTCMEDC